MKTKLTRENIISRLYTVCEKYFFPLLLGAVVMYQLFYTYTYGSERVLTFAFAAYEAVLFFVFEKLKKKKILRGLIYLLIGGLHWFAAMRLIYMGYSSGVTFNDWFYMPVSEVGENRAYLGFLFFGLGFFIVSVLYYFTVYRYRIFGVMLVTVFPFAIRGKRSDPLSTFAITLMMTVFLAMMVHQSLVSDETRETGKSKLRINRSYVLGVALFVTFAGAASMFVPKPDYKSELENGTGIFQYTFNTNRSTYDDLSEESSPRFGSDSTGEILFRARSSEDEEVIFIRRQSFDRFDYDKDRWVNDEKYEAYFGTEEMEEDNEVNSPKFVYDLMKKLAQTGRYEGFGLTSKLFEDSSAYSEESWLTLYSTTYSPRYLPAPLMIRSEQAEYVRKTLHGETYQQDYYYGTLGTNYGSWLEGENEHSYLRQLPFDTQSYRALLFSALNNGDITVAQYKNYLKIQDIYTDALGSSDEIKELAESIVKDKQSEYDKAYALMDYFEKEGYIYDNEYEPEDESIDYFLFNSKTGNCTSYATSMALMARLVGLPARYVEGFVAYERGDDGQYIVRDSHAHAFVEVYISGAGWVTFDPTVPGYRSTSGSNNNNDNNRDLGLIIEYLSRVVLFLGVLFVMIFIVLFDRIAERVFRISLMLRKSRKSKLTALYMRLMKLMRMKSKKDNRGYTSGEICEQAAGFGADIRQLTELFNECVFSQREVEQNEYEASYTVYKEAVKTLRKKPERRRRRA